MLPERPKRTSIGCRLASDTEEFVATHDPPHIVAHQSRIEALSRHCRCLSLPHPPLSLQSVPSGAQTRTDLTAPARRSIDDRAGLQVSISRGAASEGILPYQVRGKSRTSRRSRRRSRSDYCGQVSPSRRRTDRRRSLRTGPTRALPPGRHPFAPLALGCGCPGQFDQRMYLSDISETAVKMVVIEGGHKATCDGKSTSPALAEP
jgi:hypothetical protein